MTLCSFFLPTTNAAIVELFSKHSIRGLATIPINKKEISIKFGEGKSYRWNYILFYHWAIQKFSHQVEDQSRGLIGRGSFVRWNPSYADDISWDFCIWTSPTSFNLHLMTILMTPKYSSPTLSCKEKYSM